VIAPVTIAMVGGPRPEPPTGEKGNGENEEDGSIQIPYYEDLED